jgi:outer membrane lipoprotein-sorting protein
MIRKIGLLIVYLCLLSFLFSGCSKKVVKMPPLSIPPARNPVAILLEAFADTDHFQSKASIRIDTVNKGEKLSYLLNGYVLYEKPDKFRMMGYHPLGMGLFDALYRGGAFFLLSPMEKKAYTGQVSEFEDVMEKLRIQIQTEKTGGSLIPNRIQIGSEQNATRVDIRLKDISVNGSLPEDGFDWDIPEGVEVVPLVKLIEKPS